MALREAEHRQHGSELSRAAKEQRDAASRAVRQHRAQIQMQARRRGWPRLALPQVPHHAASYRKLLTLSSHGLTPSFPQAHTPSFPLARQAAIVRYETSELCRQAEDERHAWEGYAQQQSQRWGRKQREQIRGSWAGLSSAKAERAVQLKMAAAERAQQAAMEQSEQLSAKQHLSDLLRQATSPTVTLHTSAKRRSSYIFKFNIRFTRRRARR